MSITVRPPSHLATVPRLLAHRAHRLLIPAPPRADAQARAGLAGFLSRAAVTVQSEGSLALEPAPVQSRPNSIWSYALEPDKAHFVSTRLPGGVAYRVRAGVALALGEPIGPEAAWVELAAEFSAYCRARRWLPAFYQVSHAGIDAYRAVGLRALKIGEEAMIDLPSFTLVGKRIANVRHCVTYVERHGLRADFHMHGVSDQATLQGMAAVSAAWLAAAPGRGEMGYSMGSFSREALSRVCTVVARDAGGAVVAFVTFRQAGAGHCMVLDLMRRIPGAPAGTIDFLIARALERFRAEGFPFASLSLAPLANVRGEGSDSRASRLLAFLYEHGNGLYRYKSLYNFKKKFAPCWEPRYLLYPARPWSLPRVALAVALVHMPKGAFHLPRPAHLGACLVRWVRGLLDWRQGLQPRPLGRSLALMTIITLAFAVPELWRSLTLFSQSAIPSSYAWFSLLLAAGNGLGAVGLARRMERGRWLLALGACGFFAQALWGLAGGYVGGWLGWGTALALAPVEAWMIWFLVQPEVRTHLRERCPRRAIG